jgi:hypothetical protein
MFKLKKLFFLTFIYKSLIFLVYHTVLFLINLIIRFPFTSGLVIIWLTFISLIGISVLARIINTYSYTLLSVIMYYLMYMYYAVSYSYNSQNELLGRFIESVMCSKFEFTKFRSVLKRSTLRVLVYLINDLFITLTLLLIFIYIDAWYHSENKLSLILYNQVKGNDYTWWDPCNLWEL